MLISLIQPLGPGAASEASDWRSGRRSTISLHVDGIPQFPLYPPSGVYLALIWTYIQLSSLNPPPSQPSHLEQLPWLPTASRSRRGRQRRLLTTTCPGRPSDLDLKASCPLEGWGSTRMLSLPCRRRSRPSNMRLSGLATPSRSARHPRLCTHQQARLSRTPLPAP